MGNFQEKSSFVWNIANTVLRDTYKRNDFQKIILPFTVLKRFDSVLAYSKQDVLDKYEKIKDITEHIELPLLNFSVDKDGKELGFYNISKYDFKLLLQDPDNIEENLISYVDGFSDNVKDIFNYFKIKNYIHDLANNNLLYLLIKTFSESKIDLSPESTSNHEMGTIFEELIRKFSEQSNEEAGQHFTPRDVVKLMTELMFLEDDSLEGQSLVKTVYDPACGTGGMLTSCKEFIAEKNPDVKTVLFGQEINSEIYAVCKSDMLMKGEEAENIKGPLSTLSNDQLSEKKFDYIISNPPYGTNWKKDEEKVVKEAELGFAGRFGAGTPRIKDGQLLFIQHAISKMKKDEKSRIAIITNGSPLFTGSAGQGESDIRKWILENDYLEALIGLPDKLFFNTGIGTYIWILTNKKSSERKGKVQLIDATKEHVSMRKNLGEKGNKISDENIKNILFQYKQFEENNNVKIFDNEDFIYTDITVERPQRFNYMVNDERLNNLYSVNAFKKLAVSKNTNPDIKFDEEKKGEEKQEKIVNALKTLSGKTYKNREEFKKKVKDILKDLNINASLLNNIVDNLAEYDETCDIVTDTKGNKKPYAPLRDNEKIPLKQNINEYFEEEVLKYYPDAWIDESKNKEGSEINFTRYFYKYNPPRNLAEIKNDIKITKSKIQELFEEVDL